MQMLKIWASLTQCWTASDNGPESTCLLQSIQDMDYTMILLTLEQKRTKLVEMSYKKRSWYAQRIK